MPFTVAHSTLPTPREQADGVRSSQAKAILRKADVSEFKAETGGAIRRAMLLVGWSLKELAGELDRDPRQVARWLDGSERAQFDVLFAVAELRQPLVIALAEMVDAEVETVVRVRIRRSA